MAGVWGLGHSQWGVCPTGKGFEEFTGSFTTGIDSETKSFHSTPWGAGGLDWIQAHDNGHYSHVLPMKLAADAISTEAQRMIKSHADVDADKPLFLYVSYSTVSQYDPKFQRECSRIPNLWRRQHCTAIAAIDEGVGAIAAAAEAALGEDTILIFTSTNGGSPWSGGLNAPYRGAGGSTLEGGIRVPAFVTDLSPDGRYLGSGNWSYNGMTHISDWFPSLISLAKGSVASFTSSGGDGLDMTVSLKYYRDRRPHRENALIDLHDGQDPRLEKESTAYFSGEMKLIEGHIRDTVLYGEPVGDSVNMIDGPWAVFLAEKFVRVAESIGLGRSRFNPLKKCLVEHMITPMLAIPDGGVYLYNITADPKELENLAVQHADIVSVMQEKVKMSRRLRRLPQREHFMQYNPEAFVSTFVVGDCSANPAVTADQCVFTHPWTDSSIDISAVAVVNTYDTDSALASQFFTAAAVTAVTVLISVLMLLRLFRKSTAPKPVIVEKPKQ